MIENTIIFMGDWSEKRYDWFGKIFFVFFYFY